MSDRPNIALPDELAAVRAELKRLEHREAELRVLLIADPTARTGKDWIAEVRKVTQDRTDLKELRAMHHDLVDEYTFPVEITRIVLSGISEDGEIVSARKFPESSNRKRHIMSVTTQGDGLLAFIERAARDPAFDVSKMEALLRLRREERQEMARQEYFAAMSRCQALMEPVVRGKPNPGTQSRYANLEAIDGQMRPIYTAEGFSVTYGSDQAPQPGWIRVTCTVAHVAGHAETHYLDGPTATVSRAMTQIQGIGSAVTYLRRYLLSLVFNIVQGDIAGEDRDGEEGRRNEREEINQAVPLKAAAADMPRAPRVTEKQAAAQEGGKPRASERTDDQWRVWLDKLRDACAVLQYRSQVEEVASKDTVGDALRDGPPWVRREIDWLLADSFERFPAEPDEMPEVQIAGEQHVAAG